MAFAHWLVLAFLTQVLSMPPSPPKIAFVTPTTVEGDYSDEDESDLVAWIALVVSVGAAGVSIYALWLQYYQRGEARLIVGDQIRLLCNMEGGIDLDATLAMFNGGAHTVAVRLVTATLSRMDGTGEPIPLRWEAFARSQSLERDHSMHRPGVVFAGHPEPTVIQPRSSVVKYIKFAPLRRGAEVDSGDFRLEFEATDSSERRTTATVLLRLSEQAIEYLDEHCRTDPATRRTEETLLLLLDEQSGWYRAGKEMVSD